MSDLHDVLIIHDQSRTEWRARRATIREGQIVIAAGIEIDVLENPVATFTIVARDTGGRTRRYDQVKFDSATSTPPAKIVFE